jgi:uncharacterized protein YijF (DUF1287 family)
MISTARQTDEIAREIVWEEEQVTEDVSFAYQIIGHYTYSS